MQIRKFYARSIPSAMRNVRALLGENAVILSTRQLTTEDEAIIVNGSAAKVEVMAALEDSDMAGQPQEGKRKRNYPKSLQEEKSSLATQGANSFGMRTYKGAVQPQMANMVPEENALRQNLVREAEVARQRSKTLAAIQEQRKRSDLLSDDASFRTLQAARDERMARDGMKKQGGANLLEGKMKPVRKKRPAKAESLLDDRPQGQSPLTPDIRDGLTGAENRGQKQAGSVRSEIMREQTESARGDLVNEFLMQRTAAAERPAKEHGSADGAGPLQEILKQIAALNGRLDSMEGVNRKEESPLDQLVGRAQNRSHSGEEHDFFTQSSGTKRMGGVPEPKVYNPYLARSGGAPNAMSVAVNSPVVESEEAFQEFSSGMVLPARKFVAHLRRQGVSVSLIRQIVEQMHFPRQMSSNSRSEQAMREARGTFKRFVEVVQGMAPAPSKPVRVSQRARRMALVGPTGVGKTTTIAKIASRYALELNQRVVLATLDTYRVGAVEQLRTYSRLLGVPLKVADDPSQLRHILNPYNDADLILIDTPGFSPGDSEGLGRLAESLSVWSDTEVHLAMVATQRETEMRRVMDCFAPTGFSNLIFSKLDEALHLGEVLNTWIASGLDVSYFTVGQRVPEDLEKGAAEYLCKSLITR